jgi:hypothetical protein
VSYKFLSFDRLPPLPNVILPHPRAAWY